MKTRVKGFSLIEVLIASFILFISLAVFTQVFRSAIISSEKAEHNVLIALYTQLISDKISTELKNSHQLSALNSGGSMMGVKYTWAASILSVSKPPKRYIGQVLSQAEHIVKLWQVKLVIEHDNKISEYSFEEVTW
jgi:prepilin-type N-terminal cleavage/methylation domain-containing protein